MKVTALLLTKYQYYKNSSAGKNAKTFTAEHWPLHFFLFEAGVLENLVFYKSTLQALQMWLKTLWELIFGIMDLLRTKETFKASYFYFTNILSAHWKTKKLLQFLFQIFILLTLFSTFSVQVSVQFNPRNYEDLLPASTVVCVFHGIFQNSPISSSSTTLNGCFWN